VDVNKTFPVQNVLELACAAQRINGSYIKDVMIPVYAEEGAGGKIQLMYHKHGNKMLMLCTLDHTAWTADPTQAPMPLKVLPEDVARAEEIKNYFKRLLFAAIEGENEFQTNINSILSGETVKSNQFGYVACLPSVYVRDHSKNQIKKISKKLDDGFIGEIGSQLNDLDCEILESVRSKNFDAYNICAIIDNKMASWFSKADLKLGACVIVKAKVKDHSEHWLHKNPVTRLNYVKAVQ
jgi:hypothetical protein